MEDALMKYVMYQQEARDENAWLFSASSNVKGVIGAQNYQVKMVFITREGAQPQVILGVGWGGVQLIVQNVVKTTLLTIYMCLSLMHSPPPLLLDNCMQLYV
jgi:hypothetical protein